MFSIVSLISRPWLSITSFIFKLSITALMLCPWEVQLLSKKRTRTYVKIPKSHVPQFALPLFNELKGLTMVHIRTIVDYCAFREETMYRRKNSNNPLVSKNNRLNYKDMELPLVSGGAFRYDKQHIRVTKEEKDNGNKHSISFLPGQFQNCSKHIKLSRRSRKAPPLNHDVTFVLRPDDSWCMSIPCDPVYTRSKKGFIENDAICFIDPGCRTFLTLYDPTRKETEDIPQKHQTYQIEHMRDAAQEMGNWIQEQEDPLDKKELSKAVRGLWYKVKKKSNTLHEAICAYLIRRYKSIVIGDLSVTNIVKNENKLNKKSKRNILLSRLYAFKQRLLHRAKETDVKVIVQEESYTSVTCSQCDKRNSKTSSKIF